MKRALEELGGFVLDPDYADPMPSGLNPNVPNILLSDRYIRLGQNIVKKPKLSKHVVIESGMDIIRDKLNRAIDEKGTSEFGRSMYGPQDPATALANMDRPNFEIQQNLETWDAMLTDIFTEREASENLNAGRGTPWARLVKKYAPIDSFEQSQDNPNPAIKAALYRDLVAIIKSGQINVMYAGWKQNHVVPAVVGAVAAAPPGAAGPGGGGPPATPGGGAPPPGNTNTGTGLLGALGLGNLFGGSGGTGGTGGTGATPGASSATTITANAANPPALVPSTQSSSAPETLVARQQVSTADMRQPAAAPLSNTQPLAASPTTNTNTNQPLNVGDLLAPDAASSSTSQPPPSPIALVNLDESLVDGTFNPEDYSRDFQILYELQTDYIKGDLTDEQQGDYITKMLDLTPRESYLLNKLRANEEARLRLDNGDDGDNDPEEIADPDEQFRVSNLWNSGEIEGQRETELEGETEAEAEGEAGGDAEGEAEGEAQRPYRPPPAAGMLQTDVVNTGLFKAIRPNLKQPFLNKDGGDSTIYYPIPGAHPTDGNEPAFKYFVKGYTTQLKTMEINSFLGLLYNPDDKVAQFLQRNGTWINTQDRATFMGIWLGMRNGRTSTQSNGPRYILTKDIYFRLWLSLKIIFATRIFRSRKTSNWQNYAAKNMATVSSLLTSFSPLKKINPKEEVSKPVDKYNLLL